MSAEDRKALESFGFVFGGVTDKIFLECKFPKGWRKQPTEHSMWSHLLDDKGRKRGSIFFKAAFYDYNAHFSLSQRYSISPYDDAESGRFACTVRDCGNVIHTVGTRSDQESSDALRKRAEQWLAEKFPDWKKVSAYWD